MRAAFISTRRFSLFPLPPTASSIPLVRPFRPSDSIFDPKTLRAVKRDSPSREIGKRFKRRRLFRLGPIRRRLRRTIEQRYIIGRWISEGGRRRPVRSLRQRRRWMVDGDVPCRKLHYFIHAVPRRDWRKHCAPRHGQFPYAKRRSDVEQSRNRADPPCSSVRLGSVRLLRLIRIAAEWLPNTYVFQ